ncbi:hypothetical protein [uncultured Roseobacter sp.]|uniref:hypothetical protein n=1 Tax=uncultured Roseobacter sp. TaxID=114847 RepID=UPI00260BFA83|nr:hypothetical protein [uncultured Roseobacter sp.]
MTAKRGKSRKTISHEMMNEVLAEPAPDLDVDVEGANDRDVDEEGHAPPTRRPIEPGKDNAERSTLLTRAEQLMRIAASLGVAAAAILGVIEYSNANEDNRRERSLEIVRDWQAETNVQRYTSVQEFVESKVTEPTLKAQLQVLSPEALPDAQANLGRAWTAALRDSSAPQDRQIERDIDRLMLFFAQMEICIASELCNAEVLRAYFDLEVSSFWTYFKGYAELRQSANYQGYGDPVARLVERFAAMPDP